MSHYDMPLLSSPNTSPPPSPAEWSVQSSDARIHWKSAFELYTQLEERCAEQVKEFSTLRELFDEKSKKLEKANAGLDKLSAICAKQHTQLAAKEMELARTTAMVQAILGTAPPPTDDSAGGGRALPAQLMAVQQMVTALTTERAELQTQLGESQAQLAHLEKVIAMMQHGWQNAERSADFAHRRADDLCYSDGTPRQYMQARSISALRCLPTSRSSKPPLPPTPTSAALPSTPSGTPVPSVPAVAVSTALRPSKHPPSTSQFYAPPLPPSPPPTPSGTLVPSGSSPVSSTPPHSVHSLEQFLSTPPAEEKPSRFY